MQAPLEDQGEQHITLRATPPPSHNTDAVPQPALTPSVIIPTFNRAKLLPRTLRSLVAQTLPADQFEILIVDTRSTDSTKTVVEDFIASHPANRVRYLYEEQPGLLAARHRGVLEAHGEVLVFIDSDVAAAPNWLRTIRGCFQDPAVHIVGGPILPDYEQAPPDWLEAMWTREPTGRSLGYLCLIDLGDRVQWISPIFVWGANLSIRTQTLIALKGFHPDQFPSDLEHFRGDGEIGLALKAGQARHYALYHPDVRVLHHVGRQRMTPEYFELRYFQQGIADSYTRIRRRARMRRGGTSQRIRYALGTLKTHALHTIGPSAARWFRSPTGAAGRRRCIDQEAVGARGADIGALYERFWDAHARGVEFHLKAVRDIPELLEWIVRDDYWDYRLPRPDQAAPGR